MPEQLVETITWKPELAQAAVDFSWLAFHELQLLTGSNWKDIIDCIPQAIASGLSSPIHFPGYNFEMYFQLPTLEAFHQADEDIRVRRMREPYFGFKDDNISKTPHAQQQVYYHGLATLEMFARTHSLRGSLHPRKYTFCRSDYALDIALVDEKTTSMLNKLVSVG